MLICLVDTYTSHVQLDGQHADWTMLGRLTDFYGRTFPQAEARRGVLDAGQSGVG